MKAQVRIRNQEEPELFSFGLEIESGHFTMSTHDYQTQAGNRITFSVFDFDVDSLKDLSKQVSRAVKEIGKKGGD